MLEVDGFKSKIDQLCKEFGRLIGIDKELTATKDELITQTFLVSYIHT